MGGGAGTRDDRRFEMRRIGARCDQLAIDRAGRIELASLLFEDDYIESFKDLSLIELEDVAFYLRGLILMSDIFSSGPSRYYGNGARLTPDQLDLEDCWADDRGMGSEDLRYVTRKLFDDDDIVGVESLSKGETSTMMVLLELTEWYLRYLDNQACDDVESSGEPESSGDDSVDQDSPSSGMSEREILDFLNED